jgi:hypothetical protein
MTYQCEHRDDDLTLDACRRAKCSGAPGGCRRTISSFVITLDDPGQGMHPIAPISLRATCRHHRAEVLHIAAHESVP